MIVALSKDKNSVIAINEEMFYSLLEDLSETTFENLEKENNIL